MLPVKILMITNLLLGHLPQQELIAQWPAKAPPLPYKDKDKQRCRL